MALEKEANLTWESWYQYTFLAGCIDSIMFFHHKRQRDCTGHVTSMLKASEPIVKSYNLEIRHEFSFHFNIWALVT